MNNWSTILPSWLKKYQAPGFRQRQGLGKEGSGHWPLATGHPPFQLFSPAGLLPAGTLLYLKLSSQKRHPEWLFPGSMDHGGISKEKQDTPCLS